MIRNQRGKLTFTGWIILLLIVLFSFPIIMVLVTEKPSKERQTLDPSTNIADAKPKYPFSEFSFYICHRGEAVPSGAIVVIIPGIESDPGTDTVIISYNPTEKVWSIGSYRSAPNGKYDTAVRIAYYEISNIYTYTRKYERLGVRSATIAEEYALTIARNIWEDVLKSEKLK